jgi:hypothetical protein
MDSDCYGDTTMCFPTPDMYGQACVVAADALILSGKCPTDDYTLCPPNTRHAEAFCDLDADCYGNTDGCRTGTDACPSGKSCCIHASAPPSPAESARIEELNALPSCTTI